MTRAIFDNCNAGQVRMNALLRPTHIHFNQPVSYGGGLGAV